jgi:hypothetical protein
MARAVKITTPIPTLEEFGKNIGLSRARQKSLAPVFIERRPQGDYAVRRHGAEKAINVFSTQKEAVEKARELNPNGTILIERVRDTLRGVRDRWRKL